MQLSLEVLFSKLGFRKIYIYFILPGWVPLDTRRKLNIQVTFIKRLATLEKKGVKYLKFNNKNTRTKSMTLSIFCLDVLVIQKKQPDKKDQINFKIYDVTIWLKNSCSTYIIQYLKVKTTRQSNIDYVIEFDKIFFSKNDAGNEAGRPVPDLFLFFLKKAFMR